MAVVSVQALAMPRAKVPGFGGDSGGVRKHGAPLKPGFLGSSGPGSGRRRWPEAVSPPAERRSSRGCDRFEMKSAAEVGALWERLGPGDVEVEVPAAAVPTGEELKALDGLGPTSGHRRRPGLTDEVYEPHWRH